MRAHSLVLSLVLPFAASCESLPSFPGELVHFDPYANGDPIFFPEAPGTWDSYLQERGYILREDGIWKMWFTGHPGVTDGCPGEIPCRLGYATSSDGIAWTRWPTNPVENEHHTEDEMILHEGDTYYLYSEGLDDHASSMVSHDGIHWTFEGTLDIHMHDGSPLSEGPFGTPTILHEGGVWYLLYERNDDGVWLATSSDRKVWTNVRDDPVLSPGPEYWDAMEIEILQVIRYEGHYYAFFDGRGSEQQWSSGIARSDDLVHWEKYPDPLFPPEEQRTTPIVVRDGEHCFRLYNMHPQTRLSFSQTCGHRGTGSIVAPGSGRSQRSAARGALNSL